MVLHILTCMAIFTHYSEGQVERAAAEAKGTLKYSTSTILNRIAFYNMTSLYVSLRSFI